MAKEWNGKAKDVAHTGERGNDMLADLRRKALTALMDLRFGGRLLHGREDSSYAHLGAHPIEHTGYDVLPVLFDGRVREREVLVDIGCGRGRVLNWWLIHYPGRRIYGIELEPSVGERTQRRMRNYDDVTVLLGDACSLIPADGSLFYLNNPFDAAVMRRFASEIAKSPRASNELVRRILYH